MVMGHIVKRTYQYGIKPQIPQNKARSTQVIARKLPYQYGIKDMGNALMTWMLGASSFESNVVGLTTSTKRVLKLGSPILKGNTVSN